MVETKQFGKPLSMYKNAFSFYNHLPYTVFKQQRIKKESSNREIYIIF